VEGAVDHLQADPYGDESVGWPSYVDFFATFSFVLFIFIGSLLYLMYGQLGDRLFAAKVAKYVTHLKQQGIEVSVEGQKIKYDLRRHVDFDQNSAELTPRHKEYLRRVARVLPDGLQAAGVCKIVVLGKADAAKFKDDPFGNWNLSARRALAVLQFLYNCPDCGYGPEMRRKLVLLGEGDVESTSPNADDRRVDLVIDCTREVAP
jgi:flagellar motor protein MotB